MQALKFDIQLEDLKNNLNLVTNSYLEFWDELLNDKPDNFKL